jgi:hypothetical protein
VSARLIIALLLVACGSHPEPPPPPGAAESVSLIADYLHTHGVASDGTSVDIDLSVGWVHGGPPPGVVDLTLDEVGAADPPQHCAFHGDVAIAPNEVDEHSTLSFGYARVHVSGRFDPPCAPPRAGAHYHETIVWTVGTTRVETSEFMMPPSLGGDGMLHANDTEAAVYASLAHPDLRPSTMQTALVPEAEAMIDELAQVSALVPDVIDARDTVCAPGTPPPRLRLTFTALRALAAATGAHLIGSRRLDDMQASFLFPRSLAYVYGYAAGSPLQPGTLPTWPAPTDASFHVVRLIDLQLPTMIEAHERSPTEEIGTFEAGHTTGVVYVIDRARHAVACQAAFEAHSSGTVRGDATLELIQADLRSQTEVAVRAALVRAGAPMPDIAQDDL